MAAHEGQTSRVDVDVRGHFIFVEFFFEALISYQPPRYTIYADSQIDSSLFSLYVLQDYTQFCVAEWLGSIVWSGSEAVSYSSLHTNCILTYIPSPSLLILLIVALSRPSTLSPPYRRHSLSSHDTPNTIHFSTRPSLCSPGNISSNPVSSALFIHTKSQLRHRRQMICLKDLRIFCTQKWKDNSLQHSGVRAFPPPSCK